MKHDVHADTTTGMLDGSAPVSAEPKAADEQLTSIQKVVLDYLGAVSRAATLRELECVARCGRDELQQALDDLCARNLVGTLNTVIPSFVSRYPGVRVYCA